MWYDYQGWKKWVEKRYTPISVQWLLLVWLLLFSCLVMHDSATAWVVVCQPPLSMGFPKQEYWSGLPFISPGDLSHPGIKPASPALSVDSLPVSHLPLLPVLGRSTKEILILFYFLTVKSTSNIHVSPLMADSC